MYRVRLEDIRADECIDNPLKRSRKKYKFDPLRINKWCSNKELSKMSRGEINGLDSIDVQAIMAGQAVKKIRDYSKPVRVWELDDRDV